MSVADLDNRFLPEFIGIMLGDGSISKNKCKTGSGGHNYQYRTKVTLSSSEEQYRQHVCEMFQTIFDITPNIHEKKNENAVDIATYRRDVFNFLTNRVGLKTAPKWERAIIPEKFIGAENVERQILRGYFDTDGSVVLTDNNGTLYPRLEMKISPSPMQKQLIEILENQKLRFGDYDIGKGKVRVQMNGKQQLRNWKAKIGFNNEKHLKKAEKVLA